MGLNWEAVTGLIGPVILQSVANTKFKNVVLAICMQNIALKIYLQIYVHEMVPPIR